MQLFLEIRGNPANDLNETDELRFDRGIGMEKK